MEDAYEFPFMGELPKREKNKILSVWEELQEGLELNAKVGGFVPPGLAARALHVSRQRVHQFIDEGRLATVEVCGTRYITGNSLRALAQTERPSGVHLTERK